MSSFINSATGISSLLFQALFQTFLTFFFYSIVHKNIAQTIKLLLRDKIHCNSVLKTCFILLKKNVQLRIQIVQERAASVVFHCLFCINVKIVKNFY